MYLIIFGLLKGTKIKINNLEPKNNHKHRGLKKIWLRTMMPLDASWFFKNWESDELKLRGHPHDQNVSTEDLDENRVATLWSATFLRSEKQLN
jgi:hypothetical protein